MLTLFTRLGSESISLMKVMNSAINALVVKPGTFRCESDALNRRAAGALNEGKVQFCWINGGRVGRWSGVETAKRTAEAQPMRRCPNAGTLIRHDHQIAGRRGDYACAVTPIQPCHQKRVAELKRQA
ncbi:hypothetical protein EVAR_86208_1 [Eumeta japonica]|uniref:Uncharacterized protein n=1 Tax=Eumeta variegata TaxID=151549 RepID=A0A4C1UBI6_EUMVA|nr:hypothetical protein EVAR_86208_1 [Eumeta japonica]